MELSFRAGNEFAKLIIDREKKKLQVCSSKTNYKTITAAWTFLFDKGLEAEQEKITDGLTDEQFRLSIIQGMAKNGYKFEPKPQ